MWSGVVFLQVAEWGLHGSGLNHCIQQLDLQSLRIKLVSIVGCTSALPSSTIFLKIHFFHGRLILAMLLNIFADQTQSYIQTKFVRGS